MKFIKLVLGDAMADIGMGDLDFDRLNQLGIHDDISSVQQSSEDEEAPKFRLP